VRIGLDRDHVVQVGQHGRAQAQGFGGHGAF
jgi:hypothetical protein